MPNPFTRDQTLENAAFLRALRRTGNVREAAREIGKHVATMRSRRRAHAAFAVRWDAALVAAAARLRAGGGAREAGDGPPVSLASASRAEGPRTLGGEEVVVLMRDGTLQVRRARAGRLTKQAEHAFLAALSSTANVALSAAAAGASVSAFYKRKRDPGFAREWRLALEQGWEALNGALLHATLPDAHEGDAWRHNDPPPIPPMTATQAIQLLHLHHKEARLWATRPDIFARRPGETSDGWSARRADNYIAELARAAEGSELARVAREGGLARSRWEPPAPALPALEQVTGWSRAKRPARVERPHVGPAGFAEPPPPDPASGQHHPETALFGGWRLEDLSPEQRAKGKAALAEARRRSPDPDKPRARPNR